MYGLQFGSHFISRNIAWEGIYSSFSSLVGSMRYRYTVVSLLLTWSPSDTSHSSHTSHNLASHCPTTGLHSNPWSVNVTYGKGWGALQSLRSRLCLPFVASAVYTEIGSLSKFNN